MPEPSRFTKVLIANRGEIAVRVARSARALGYPTVAVYSDADLRAPHVEAADEAVRLGPAPAAESYLAIDRVLAAARASGADAVHPGYGFLAENAGFARACANAGLVFIGPDADAIELMGDKARAKARMAAAGVPCVPGHDGAGSGGSDPGADAFARAAAEIGYPVLIKAVAGGGGRGLRRVDAEGELAEALARARSEAESAFGDGRLMLEKLLTGVRHVEVQVFGDRHGNVIHLGERDCSVQRRHQKVVEESPSPAVDAALRRRLGAAAVAAGKAVGYAGAGTVELLLTAAGDFYFMEMNTRLQVEHPVTELVTGLDLVEWQLRVAAGEPLPLEQDDVVFHGHAIEARLYAEDPAAGFLPRPGTLLAWTPPVIEGVRVDHALAAGTEVSAAYDPLLAKLVAHGRDREEARRRLLLALASTEVLGVVTNRRFLGKLLAHPAFVAGEATTAFVGEALTPQDLATPPPDPEVVALAAILLSRPDVERNGPPGYGAAGWPVELEWDDGAAAVRVEPLGESRYRVTADASVEIELLAVSDTTLRYESDGRQRTLAWCRDGGAVWLDDGPLGRDRGGGLSRRFAPRQRRRAPAPVGDGRVTAPMAGRVKEVRATAGAACAAGETLLVLEAMKLETPIAAPFAGVVAEVRVAAGEQVRQRQLLAVVAPTSPSPEEGGTAIRRRVQGL